MSPDSDKTASDKLGAIHFSLGRIPAQQHSISRDATEEFVGIELFVLSFAGERERSTRPAIPALTTGTARAVFRHFKFRDYSLGNHILSTPLLYFLYLHGLCLVTVSNDKSVGLVVTERGS